MADTGGGRKKKREYGGENNWTGCETWARVFLFSKTARCSVVTQNQCKTVLICVIVR